MKIFQARLEKMLAFLFCKIIGLLKRVKAKWLILLRIGRCNKSDAPKSAENPHLARRKNLFRLLPRCHGKDANMSVPWTAKRIRRGFSFTYCPAESLSGSPAGAINIVKFTCDVPRNSFGFSKARWRNISSPLFGLRFPIISGGN